MARLILHGYFIVFFVFGAIALRRCSEDALLASNETHGDASAIVSLPDGSTMLAPNGTVGRDLVDWLSRREPGQRTFELGGQEFVGRTSELTPESIGRIPRLIAMLRANPDVKVVIVGHTDPSGDQKSDLEISRARANALLRILRDARISATRLSIQARAASDPIASNDSPDNRKRNQRVSLVLSRTE